MGERVERLERDLEAERQNLGRNIHELERRASEYTDWRWYYRHHPVAVLTTAFGGAVLLGLLTRSRRAGPQAAWEPESPGFETHDYEPRGVVRTRLAPHLASSAGRLAEQAGTTWDHVVDVLVGIAAAKTIDFVGQHIPGFNEEYTRRHGSNPAF